MAEIQGDSELVALDMAAELKPNPQAWLEESRAFAVERVYTREILSKLELVARGVAAKAEMIDLSVGVLKGATHERFKRAI